jgi:hypothetical protein
VQKNEILPEEIGFPAQGNEILVKENGFLPEENELLREENRFLLKENELFLEENASVDRYQGIVPFLESLCRRWLDTIPRKKIGLGSVTFLSE